MRYLFFLLFSVSVFAQTIVSENFNNLGVDTTNTVLKLDFTSAAANIDLGNRGNNLSHNYADAAALAAALESGNPIVSSGYRWQTGSNKYLYSTDADFDLTTAFTVVVVIRTGLAESFYLQKLNGSTFHGWATRPELTQLRLYTSQGSGAWTNAATTLSTGVWHVCVFTFDNGNYQLFLDGDTLATGTGKQVPNTTGASVEFRIGRNEAATYDQYWEVAYVHVKDAALSYNEGIKVAYLPSKWIAKNNNFSRNLATPEFYTTFWDTIGVPLSNATLGNNQVWQLSYKGKSSDATKTIKAWIGSAATAKSSVYTVTAGTAFATNTVNFGDGFALSSDTLWFASASTADTVSVDDVVLLKQLLTQKNAFGKPFTTGFPKPFK